MGRGEGAGLSVLEAGKQALGRASLSVQSFPFSVSDSASGKGGPAELTGGVLAP